MPRPLVLLTLLIVVSSVCVGYAKWASDGVPVCTAQAWQRFPRSVPDGSGGAIITWSDERRASEGDIYAQRIQSDGQPLWVTDGVAVSISAGSKENPRLTSDGAGGAIITWPVADEIYAQRVDGSGNVLWDANGVSICTEPGKQALCEIASDGAGGAIIIWLDWRAGSTPLVYCQRVDANGTVLWAANGMRVCGAPDSQFDARIVSDGTGGGIIVWEDGRGGPLKDDIYAQRVDADGDTLWGPDGAPICTNSASQDAPELVSDGAGGAIITWADDRPSSVYNAGQDIYAQRVDYDGNALWPVDGIVVCGESYNQGDPHLVTDDAGGAIVTWLDFRDEFQRGTDIYAQRIDADGALLWVAGGTSVCRAGGGQYVPRLAPDRLGGAIIAWRDGRSGPNDIYVQRVDAAGNALWATDGLGISQAPSAQDYPWVVTDSSGDAVIAWEDLRNGDFDIYAHKILADGTIAPTLLRSFRAIVRKGVPVVEWTLLEAGEQMQFTVSRSEGPNERFVALSSVDIQREGMTFFFEDHTCVGGCRYQVEVSDEDGRRILFVTGVLEIPRLTASLRQSSPNPFNSMTRIGYTVYQESVVYLRVYDIAGKRVRSLVSRSVSPGSYEVEWDGRDSHGRPVATGIYFYRLTVGNNSLTRKALLLK